MERMSTYNNYIPSLPVHRRYNNRPWLLAACHLLPPGIFAMERMSTYNNYIPRVKKIYILFIKIELYQDHDNISKYTSYDRSSID
jgi:hypothetical protein